MDMEWIRRRLSQTERRVEQGERRIHRQREICRELQSGGHDTVTAKACLAVLEASQSLYVVAEQRLREMGAEFAYAASAHDLQSTESRLGLAASAPNEAAPSPPARIAAALSVASSDIAISRCVAMTGRTSTRSFLSSAFSVVGIRRLSRASSTAWW